MTTEHRGRGGESANLQGDYQWPTPSLGPDELLPGGRDDLRAKTVAEIEGFFEGRLATYAVLVPSGRAGLAILLRLEKANRSQTAYAPRWSSHCVWSTLSRYADPTIEVRDADIILAVHKWGQIHHVAPPAGAWVIEDSVDSILLDRATLFPNGGSYEVLSLPKLIGSYAGGIILMDDRQQAEWLRKTCGADIALGRHQSRLRYQASQGTLSRYRDWQHLEYLNTTLDINALRNITACLGNYDTNARAIQRRLDELAGYDGLVAFLGSYPSRLPPLLALPCRHFREIADDDIMVRHVNTTRDLSRPEYDEAYLLPLHFGIGDEHFHHIASRLNQAVR